MEHQTIYQDIAERTGGDIYIGVVGPVRTGKSTFIKKFMENLVIPNIQNEARRERAVDELPQSAAGRTIMTTEPKFIPEEAVEVALEDGSAFRVRMIDLNSPLNYSIKKTLPEQSGGVFFCGTGENGQKNRPCLCLEQSLFFQRTRCPEGGKTGTGTEESGFTEAGNGRADPPACR